MKNNANQYSFLLKVTVLFTVFFNIYNTNAQVDEDTTTPTDTIGYHKGRIGMANPPSVVELYKYDPITDRYIFSSTVTGLSVNYPIILSPAEYRKRVLKESIHKYFKEKEQAIAGQVKGSEDKRRNLIPRMYVNSGLFTTIFGSNTIDIKPTGSVEIDLGMRYTKQDNPALTPQNRTSTTFDFNQRISVGMQGKVGTRLGVNFNYDTQSTFAFQNLFKLEFNPGDIGIDGVGTIDDAKNLANKAKNFKDNIPKSLSGTNDDILQKIELGNISMPLSSSLIRGAQSLFGVKAQFKFGNTMITALYSEQKSQTKTVTSENGGTVQLFDLFALDYDADRHFFLSQYFRNNYDKSLKSYPVIDSRVQITRVEVWITNKQNRVSSVENNNRNIVAIQDLGEAPQTGFANTQIVGANSLTWTGAGGFFNTTAADTPADNANNQYNPAYLSTTQPAGTGILNQNIRDIANLNLGFTGFPPGNNPSQGKDFAMLENARKLTANEFTFHPQLGYISLQQKLNNDEVLAVAYQYTIGDKVYQVGEFGNDGVAATTVPTTGIPNNQSLILKMLKSTLTSTTQPMWNLMMKNIYQIPQAYQLQAQDFRFNIVYSDPSPLNYIKLDNSALPTIDNVSNRPLLNVFNVDRLSAGNDVQPLGDGFFDYIPGMTVDTQNGRIIFTTIEPFGKHLFEKLRNNPSEDYYATGTTSFNVNQAKYVYKSLYTGTQTQALQDAGKNKFELKGKYKASGGDGIPIGAVNVPKGSVVVTAGGRKLTEGVDYTVNYQQGRVQILDPSLQASGTPIQVSVENNSIFGQQTRRFYGLNVEHKFSDKFMIGGTFLRMVERPLTQKSTYGQESVNNTIYGLNGAFATEVPFLTRLINKLPNIDTDVPSNISIKAEVAYLSPDTPSQDKFNGEATIYVDDFEGSQSNIDLRAPSAWQLSSVPENITSDYNFVTQVSPSNPLGIGYKRAKINWYTIDPTFYQGTYEVSSNETRRIYINELYPNQQIATGQTTLVPTFDLSYYPTEMGPYNNDPLFATNPKKNNFGGLMRAINTTNFEQSNVEYIQFWMLDPTRDRLGNVIPAFDNGKIFFNLGEISEDVLQDGHKQYENGLPAVGSTTPALPVVWGKIPTSTSLIYAFDNDTANRALQDLGYDGINDSEEAGKYNNSTNPNDPANDNYQYFEAASGNILQRYKNYNNPQGNSPVDITNNNRGNSTVPDVEDVNRDNTMNTINAYYEYSIDIDPTKMTVASGGRYITDDKTTTSTAVDGLPVTAHWVQYKIPIANPERNIGGISDFRSIRFMRMFMTGFNQPLTVRFGALDLVRGEWRRYNNLLNTVGSLPGTTGTNFDVSSVSIIENNYRLPIPYVLPPGVTRELLANGNATVAQNEKSLSLRISGNTGLIPQDSRGVFKNVNIDMRQYKTLKMFLHAESLPSPATPLLDGEMAGFIRFGNDFTDNFYQVEIPLKVSAQTARSESEIWPEENNLDLAMKDLTALKIRSIQNDPNYPPDANGIRYMNVGNTKIGIKGNPNFGLVRTLMVGIKNTNLIATNKNIVGEVWTDELRLAGIDNKGGMAAVASIESNIADFATVSATGKMSTIGFGALEQGTNERSREDLKLYDIVTNLSLGQLLPKKWGIRLPFNFGVGEQIITPKYDPFNLDIELNQLIDITSNQSDKDRFLDRAIDYTKRNSINFIGVKKDKTGNGKPHIYDIENITLSNSFNQTLHHDFEIEKLTDQQAKTTVDYSFSFQPKAIEPFAKAKFMKKSSYWKLLQDFNFNYLPSSINFSTTILRNFNKQQFRQIDVTGIPLNPLFRRNYNFNYQYGFNYNLTKALKLSFNASTNNLVRSYLDENKIADPNNTVWTDYWNIGETNQHSQQLIANYELPFAKIPFLAFIKSSYTYTGNFAWQRASEASSPFITTIGNPPVEAKYFLGNTVQNSALHKINADFNMDGLYKFLGLKDKKPKPQNGSSNAPKPGEKVVAANTPKPVTDENVFIKGFKGILMSVKNIKADYTENSGTVLPGYLPGLGFLGSTNPSLGFVFGLQDDVRYAAAQNGWLTNYPNFNQNFTQVTTKTLRMTANIDLFPDFKIDLTADRTFSENHSEQYDVINGLYNARSPYSTGNFAVSTVMLKTAFKESDETVSSAFSDFRHNRLIIANRLAIDRGIDINDPLNISPDGFPKGYGKNSQAVLLPSFLAAYTGFTSDGVGKAANSISFNAFKEIPLPNWNMKYSGLMRYNFFKENFKRFSFQHAYKSSYTINSYRTNLDYNLNPNGLDIGGNFLNKTIISNINLVEQFNPLLRMDFELKNSIKILGEMKKDRALSMSFDNNLLTEVTGLEYVVGFGYRIKDVRMNSKFADNATGEIKSDINIKADFSMRNTKTIVRHLDYENNQLAGGQQLWSIKLTADYAFSRNLSAIFFYDHSFNKAVISTSFPLTNIRGGFTIRYAFGN